MKEQREEKEEEKEVLVKEDEMIEEKETKKMMKKMMKKSHQMSLVHLHTLIQAKIRRIRDFFQNYIHMPWYQKSQTQIHTPKMIHHEIEKVRANQCQEKLSLKNQKT